MGLLAGLAIAGFAAGASAGAHGGAISGHAGGFEMHGGGYGGWHGAEGYGRSHAVYGYGGWGVSGFGLFLSTLPYSYSTWLWNGVPYYYADINYYLWNDSLGQCN